jgi:hypothetical protein
MASTMLVRGLSSSIVSSHCCCRRGGVADAELPKEEVNKHGSHTRWRREEPSILTLEEEEEEDMLAL